jgi:thiol-disulfide isomerase/thioredoxin
MKKIFLLIFTLLFSTFLITSNAKQPSAKAPGIALEDINGNFTMLSSLLNSSNVVISFWSYDCLPCRKEMPELQKMADSQLFKNKKVKVILVYVEATTEKTKEDITDKQPRQKALEVLNKLNIKETCLLDIYGMAFNNYRKANNIKKAAMPLLFLVNKEKNIIFSAIGYNENNLKELEKAVKFNL